MRARAPTTSQAAQTAYPPGMAFIDGEYCSLAEAKLPILDWGFLRSDATYDVVHVWQGRFFRLDWHLERFYHGMDKLKLTLPFDRERLVEILRECVKRAALDNAYVEMICTRGVSPTFSRDPRDAVNRFIAFAIPFGWIANEEQRARGLHIAVSKVARIPPLSVDPTIKNYHWLDFIVALFDAYERGAENVVLVDLEGCIAEGPGFNLFTVSNGRVVTPAAGVLEGITRRTVMALCEELGMPVERGLLTAERLYRADEVFITSTAGGVMSVTRIDGRNIADGKPGPVTARIRDLYWQKHEDADWTVEV